MDMNNDMRFVIITGMSGAGKTQVIRALEDLGFFCIDNLPPNFIPKFAELCIKSQTLNRVGLVVDIRGGDFFDFMLDALGDLDHMALPYEILFLEASNDVLVKRYKETRRRHPLAHQGSILEGIQEERKRLEELRGKADKIIDTSHLAPKDFKNQLKRIYGQENPLQSLGITVVSFGYKYGIPLDADMVFDVRFLPNPFYLESLKDLTGNDQSVRDYVLKWPETHEFLQKFFALINFLLPYYVQEGKMHFTIAIGCTGGNHRSVTVAHVLNDFLKKHGYNVRLEHRDIYRRLAGGNNHEKR